MKAYLGRIGIWAVFCASISETLVNEITSDPFRLPIFVVGGILFLSFGIVKEDKWKQLESTLKLLEEGLRKRKMQK